MRIPLPEVPGLFSLLSSGVHYVTIRFQHISAINFVVAEATGGGDRVDFSQLITNLFPYDDGMSLPNESFVAFSNMKTMMKMRGWKGKRSIPRLGSLSYTAYLNPWMMGLAVLIACARILYV